MKTDNDNIQKVISNKKVWIYGIISLCLLLIFYIALFNRNNEKFTSSLHPDISQCTQLEISFYPSLYEGLEFDEFRDSNFLSTYEIELLKSQKTIIIEDSGCIETINYVINSADYSPELLEAAIMMKPRFIIRCFQKRKLLCEIIESWYTFIVDYKNGHKRVFKLNSKWPNFFAYITGNTKTILQRISCGNVLRWLDDDIFSSANLALTSYPNPDKWNDIIQQYLEEDLSIDRNMGGYFRCPSAGEGKCHYAMNPNCKPISPGDMVLLFETKAGWNQHGGPELFTFDNHDPKGGCVLLNDGTVKFIRTEEELNNLRWK